MNVLGFVREPKQDAMSAIEYYRCYLPLREVDRHDNDIEAMALGPVEIAEMIDETVGIDVYHWPRMSYGDCEEFIAEVHRRGGKFVIDSDDDLTGDYRLVFDSGEAFKNVLAHADYVTCTTQALADHLAQYTQRPPVVLKNCIDVDWFEEVASRGHRGTEGLTIGFSGTPTHWGDWYLPAVPFWRIARDFDVTPLLHGEVPRYLTFAAPEDRLKQLGGVPFAIYPVLLNQFDIVLCAVDPNDEFNSGKSAIKALECMAVGAVPICSRFGPYIELQAAGAPIVLVAENTRDAWYEAMRDLIEDEERRLQLRAAGRSWVRENRDMTRTGYKQWEAFYRGICTS